MWIPLLIFFLSYSDGKKSRLIFLIPSLNVFFFFLNWCSDLWIYFDVNVHFWSKHIILSVFHYFTPYRRFCFANLLNYSQKIRASSIFLWFSFNKLTNIIFFYPAAVYILVLVLLMNLRLTIGWMSGFFFFF